MKLKLAAFTLAFGLLSSTAYAGQACHVTEQMGAPIAAPGKDNQLISLCRMGYQSMYDVTTKTPYWVAEDIVKQNVVGKFVRKESWTNDPDVPEPYRALLSDYKNSGYARGHMAAAANFRRNDAAQAQSYFTSNILPQQQKCNNSGVWSKIEDMTRDWAVSYGELYVVTGGIFSNNPEHIGNGVAIPSHIYKVIYNPVLKKSLAFLVPNKEVCNSVPRDFAVTQDIVETVTKIKFFPNVAGYERTNQIWQ